MRVEGLWDEQMLKSLQKAWDKVADNMDDGTELKKQDQDHLGILFSWMPCKGGPFASIPGLTPTPALTQLKQQGKDLATTLRSPVLADVVWIRNDQAIAAYNQGTAPGDEQRPGPSFSGQYIPGYFCVAFAHVIAFHKVPELRLALAELREA